MQKAKLSVLSGAALFLAGCIIVPPLKTTTEVITSSDAVQVFGAQAAIRVGQQQIIFRWDPGSHSYKAQPPEGGLVTAVRAARLKGDIYLLQGELEDATDGYVLVPFRVSGAREVVPLACDVSRTGAEAFGVRTGPAEDVILELSGSRAAIVSALASVVGSCRPQLQVETFAPSGRDLSSQAAVAPTGSPDGCRPCAAGACIQGTLRDQTGAALPGATIRAMSSGTPDAASARSDASGNFLLSGIADGRAEVRVELAGFSSLRVPAIQVRAGTTYLFDQPFELEVAHPPFETVAAAQQPRLCPARKAH